MEPTTETKPDLTADTKSRKVDEPEVTAASHEEADGGGTKIGTLPAMGDEE